MSYDLDLPEITPEERAKLDRDYAKYGICFVGTDGFRIDPEDVLLPAAPSEEEG